jgi:hypothetical protein
MLCSRRNHLVTLMNYFSMCPSRLARPTVKMGEVMRFWLEHDPVALAVLVFGIAAVELLAFSIS